MSALIEFDAVCKYYQMGDTTVKAADHITMKIEKGEFVAITGSRTNIHNPVRFQHRIFIMLNDDQRIT